MPLYLRTFHRLTPIFFITVALVVLMPLFSVTAYAATPTIVSVTPSPARLGTPVTIAAHVEPTTTLGFYAFYDGATILDYVNRTDPAEPYMPALTTSALSAGTHNLRVRYLGTADGGPADSAVFKKVITTVPADTLTPYGGFLMPGLTKAIATGDFNRDGKLDIVVGDYSGWVGVFLGIGDGSFNLVTISPVTPFQISGVAVGDFNADGKQDLALAAYPINLIYILMGNGDGTFTPASTPSFASGDGVWDILVSDFNHDGKADLATADSANQSFSVHLGNGDGTFAPKTTVALGSDSRSISAGILRDPSTTSAVDLVIAMNGSVAVLLGNGDGTFAQSTLTIPGSQPTAVEIADLNGDGFADLAVASSSNNSIYIFTGDGTGSFTPGAVLTASGPASIKSGDFDGDGKIDLFVSNAVGVNVAVYRGNGNATFQAPQTFASDGVPQTLVLGDFNGDSRTDVAVAGYINKRVDLLRASAPPDLTVTTTHPGHFYQGQKEAPYTITVTNSGGAITTAAIAVTDTLPAKMTAIDMSGTGWTCTVGILTCVRYDALDAGGSFPPITLTVDVADDAPTTGVANTVVVSGGGESNTSNNTAVDSTTIIQSDDLAVTMTHTGNFFAGQKGATYTITVKNLGPSPTWSTVQVFDTLPAGLTATALEGAGWTCTLSDLRCACDDVLAVGASYPPITLTVDVSPTAPSLVVNKVLVGSGGDFGGANSIVDDMTTIVGSPDMFVQKYHTGDFVKGQQGAAYTFDVFNPGGSPSVGTVTVTDPLPAGLTFNSVSGTGWSCTTPAVGANGTVSCSRSDALDPGSAYPSINLRVNVLPAATDFVNIATISGGGETNTDNDTSNDPTTVVMAMSATSVGGSGSFGSTQLSAEVAFIPPAPGVVIGVFPSGTVTFREGATTLGTAVLDATGHAVLSLSTLSVGAHMINVEYPGDAHFMASTGVASVTVATGTPTVELLCPAATYDGSAHSCTANVTGVGGATVSGSTVITYEGSSTAPTNAGSYSVFAAFTSTDGNYSNGTASTTFTIAGAPTTVTMTGSPVTYPANVELTITFSSPIGIPTGSAMVTVGTDTPVNVPLTSSGVINVGLGGLTIPAGTYTISVSYPAQGNYAATSKTFDYVVNPGASGTSLTSSLNPALPGNSVTFTATVTGAGLMPSGNVAFRDGSTTLATVAVNAAGVATFTTSTLITGTHPMTAVYAGDTHYSGSTSIAVSQVVGTPTVTITGGGSSLTVQAGQSASANLTVGATGTLTAPVTFTCSGLPQGSSCSFNPGSVGPTMPGTVAVTISTTSLKIMGANRHLKGWAVTLAMMLPGILVLPAVLRRRSRLAIILGLLVIAIVLIGFTGCGSGSRTQGISNADTATPAGSYVVKVTGASSGATSGTININMTVIP